MSSKKDKRSIIWGMLFTYLAVSKVVYYSSMVTYALNRGGLRTMGEAVLDRLLTQDMLIILIILLTFNTEKFVASKITKYSKAANKAIVHTIDYVIYTGVLAIYFLAMMFFGIFNNINWLVFLIYSSTIYLAIIAVLEIKEYIKKKQMIEYTTDLNVDEKLAMLKTLLDNDVLTQEEYDRKKEGLQ